MKSFKDYLAESVRITEAPVTEDHFDFELDGCLIESEVIDHTEDSITVLVDETAMAMLDNLGMLEAEEDFPLLDPNKKFTLDNPKIITVVDKDEDDLTGADERQTGMLKAITGSQVIWKKPNTWASAQDSARVMGYILQYAGDDDTFNASYQGRLPRKEPMMQKGDLPDQAVSPMAEMLRLAGIKEAEDYGQIVAPHAKEIADAVSQGMQANTADPRVSWYMRAFDILTKQSRTTRVNPQLLNTAMMGAGISNSQSSNRDPAVARKLIGYLNSLQQPTEATNEAEYHGRKVPLGKPMRGDVKKFKVYVKDPSTGNVKKVNFGDPNMRIKKSNPARRRSFRARHNCANPGPRTKARYWSCRKW